jgi:sigma-B regulation protein RsbU (phosphoserine phosphatase)
VTGAGTAEDLFEHAPCGYLSTRLDGTIVRVNRTFEEWTGLRREELVEQRRFQELLSPGGRIYHETHYAPLLQMQGWVRAIAVEIVRADGTRLPALVNSVLHDDHVRTAVFDATDRRLYEEELLRARRHEQEVALQLQRSLLSGTLPSGDAVEVGVAYHPGEQGLEVGGDWYDAFWLEEPRQVGIVVGDVVGRGIAAAATMGQLRSAARALASTRLGPGALLDALDGYARRHEVGQMTTIAYAEVDLGTRAVRYACAGHPPPVLVEPGQPARFGWDGRSTPLDAHLVVAGERSEGTAELAPGGTVVLYTDGLVERRDRPLRSGLDALLASVEEVRDERPDALAAALTAGLARGAAHDDDVCVLALRVGG